jgi:hypothetical protein
MTVKFPAVCPSTRQLTPGQYPIKRFTAVNGANTMRLFGSKAFDATLLLSFNCSDSEAGQLLASYHDSRGGFEILELPERIWEGMDAGLSGRLPTGLNWRWREEPTIESLTPGRSKVSVSLIATLD